MEIRRDRYLDRLTARKWNGRVKVVTGVRRSGKSYLLFKLFRDHLISEGVTEDQIIAVALDDVHSRPLRDALKLVEHIDKRASDPDGRYYVLLDEIQYVPDFEDAINTLIRKSNLDVYVTGSNSRCLSSDLRTQLRGRGDPVHVYPLCFSEFMSAFDGSPEEGWKEYCRFGGMPETVSMATDEQKETYLENIVEDVYKKDMEERYDIRMPDELSIVMRVLSSSTGSLTNPLKLSNTMRSAYRSNITDDTVNRYLEIMEDSFLFEKAVRYDIKGRRHLGSPMKYYVIDVGLRNALLNFREMDIPHIMENILYLELRSRGFAVDVGVVEVRERDGNVTRSLKLEIDFVVNRGDRRYYIQSAYALPDTEKRERETRPFRRVNDGFKKILVVGDDVYPYRDESGVLTIGIRQFLMDGNSLYLR